MGPALKPLLCVLVLILAATAAARTGAQSTSTLQQVAQLGGWTRAVTLADGRLFMGQGPRLAILSTADPTRPTLIGQTSPLPESVEGVGLPLRGGAVDAGSYAYVATFRDVHAIDVSDPSQPRAVGKFGVTDVRAIAVSDGYAYLGTGSNGLRIFDVSDPTQPVQVGSYPNVYPDGLELFGSYLYVGGSRVLDVSTPSAPRDTGSFASFAQILIRDGDVLYSIGGSAAVYGLADPARPTETVRVTMGQPSTAVKVGPYLYVGEVAGRIDVYEARTLRLVGTRTLSVRPYELSHAPGYLFLASDAGLRVFSLADPLQPTEVGSYEILNYASGLAFSDQGLVVASLSPLSGLWRFDVTTPSSPRANGSYQVDEGAARVAVQVGFAYAVEPVDGSTSAADIDVVDLRSLDRLIGAGSVATVGGPRELIATSQTLFTGGSGGIRVFDLRDPTRPEQVGVATFGDLTYTLEMALSGSRLYAATQNREVVVLDVADRTRPTYLGRCLATDTVASLAADGNRVYAGIDNRATVQVFDTTDPARCSTVGTYPAGFTPFALEPADGSLWVGGAFLDRVDVSDASQPRRVERYDPPGRVEQLLVRDGRVYVAAGSGGLVIFGQDAVVTPTPGVPPTPTPGVPVPPAGAFRARLPLALR